MRVDSTIDLRPRSLGYYLCIDINFTYEISGYKLAKQLGDSQVGKRLLEAVDCLLSKSAYACRFSLRNNITSGNCEDRRRPRVFARAFPESRAVRSNANVRRNRMELRAGFSRDRNR